MDHGIGRESYTGDRREGFRREEDYHKPQRHISEARGIRGQSTRRNDFGRGTPTRSTGYGENFNNSGRGGNLNPSFGNFGSGYKRGNGDRESNIEQRQ
jgi:hypothetical protein